MPKAALILFITRRNATAVIETAAKVLADHPACVRSLESDDPLQRRNYRFASPKDDSRVISLALLPVVVPRG